MHPLPVFLLLISLPALAQNTDWPVVTNDKAGTRYSPLTQINRANVHTLKPAWTYHTKDHDKGATIECTPLVINGTVYITTVKTKVVALNAETGAEKWSYDPYSLPAPAGGWKRASGGVNRGLAYWTQTTPTPAEPADSSVSPPPSRQERLLVGLSDGRLLSLDPATQKPDPVFGKDGYVDLRATYKDRDLSNLPYGPTSAPMVFENLVIVGCSNGEGHPAAPGDVRAFDVRTGAEVWRFHTIPRPGEEFADTWEKDAWKDRGGANPWAGFTLDESSGTLFCGTGSAGPDFYGAGRKGDNLFANCVLALDARTGKRLWHFQTVRHDLWDHDLPTPPVVCTMKVDGKDLPVVAQVTKTGYCFVLDRKTGKPVFGVKEVEAPPSDVPGEQAAKTQPIPLKPPPFARQYFTEDEATTLSPEATALVKKKLKEYRADGPHAPPSTRGTVIIPGFHGGATWAGAAFDPTTQTLYLNSNEAPYVGTLKPVYPKHNNQPPPAQGDPRSLRGFATAESKEPQTPSHYEPTGYSYFRDGQPLPAEREHAGGQQGGYPAIKPPWGWLNAIDLSKGDFAWRTPLGEFPELTAKGIPPTGTESFGGAIVTAGNLLFIGGTKDEKFRAFDTQTGKTLWEHQLPAGGYATPAAYAVNGKQYVIIAAGGGGKNRTKSADAFIAFTLP